MIFDNARYLSWLIKRVYLLLMMALVIVLALALFFALKWYQATKLDNVYIITPDSTMEAERAEGSLARTSYEVTTFAKMFLEKAFAHNEYTWEENLTCVAEIMDQASRKLLLSKMDESIEHLYKEKNAISTVSLKEIEINQKTHPYEVLGYYTTHLRFPLGKEAVYKDADIAGGIYFQLELLPRSKNNPYGMRISHLKFVGSKT